MRATVKSAVAGFAQKKPGMANAAWSWVYPLLRQRAPGRPVGTISEPIGAGSAPKSRVRSPAQTVQPPRTGPLTQQLPVVMRKHNIRRIYDAPCGDYLLMRDITLPSKGQYIGADPAPERIEQLQAAHGSPMHQFRCADILSAPVPQVDLWLCQDLFQQICFADALQLLRNASKAGIRYFAATTAPFISENRETSTGAPGLVNLGKAPFDLPPPLESLDDFLAPEPPRKLAIWSKGQLLARFGI